MRWVSTISLLLTVAACSAQSPVSRDDIASDEGSDGYHLELGVTQLEASYGGACNVHFEATNIGKNRIATATIKFAAKNSADETIADGFFIMSNLMPSKTQNGYHTVPSVDCADIKALGNLSPAENGGVVEGKSNSIIPVKA